MHRNHKIIQNHLQLIQHPQDQLKLWMSLTNMTSQTVRELLLTEILQDLLIMCKVIADSKQKQKNIYFQIPTHYVVNQRTNPPNTCQSTAPLPLMTSQLSTSIQPPLSTHASSEQNLSEIEPGQETSSINPNINFPPSQHLTTETTCTTSLQTTHKTQPEHVEEYLHSIMQQAQQIQKLLCHCNRYRSRDLFATVSIMVSEHGLTKDIK